MQSWILFFSVINYLKYILVIYITKLLIMCTCIYYY